MSGTVVDPLAPREEKKQDNAIVQQATPDPEPTMSPKPENLPLRKRGATLGLKLELSYDEICRLLIGESVIIEVPYDTPEGTYLQATKSPKEPTPKNKTELNKLVGISLDVLGFGNKRTTKKKETIKKVVKKS